MKIKKFFQDYGYAVVKLITTHIAMSIFGLMAYLPTGKNLLLGGLLGVATVIFYFFMVNNDIGKIGAKDSVRTVRGKPAAHPAKGFIIGAVSAIPDVIICGLYIFFWYFQSYEWAMEPGVIFTFIGVLWEGIFMGLTCFVKAPIVFAAIPFVITAFAGISYILGMKNIHLMPLDDNPEEAERKRDAKKNKKKFTFSKPKTEEDAEDEDELM